MYIQRLNQKLIINQINQKAKLCIYQKKKDKSLGKSLTFATKCIFYCLYFKMDYTQLEIISGCIRKDSEYQRALYEEYSPELYGVCLRYMKNKEDAEDILQDSFIKVLSSPEHLDGVKDLRKWLRRVFVNNILNSLKLKRRFQNIGYRDIETYEEKDSLFDVDTKRFRTSTLLAALHSLKPEERILFNMIELEEMTYAEVEHITGRKASTLRSINMRAKIKMRNFLKDKENEDYE